MDTQTHGVTDTTDHPAYALATNGMDKQPTKKLQDCLPSQICRAHRLVTQRYV